jgi:CheY-like chemotaxis protein
MKRVLIVDDSPSVLQMLRFVLESEHYDVITANDGAEGLEKIGESVPDLVLTDSIMPGMDGYAFLQKLKEQPGTSAIPVIMLTSEDPDTSEHAGRHPKPDGFIRKSSDFTLLLNKVSAALASR